MTKDKLADRQELENGLGASARSELDRRKSYGRLRGVHERLPLDEPALSQDA